MKSYRNFSARLTEDEHRRMRTAAALADMTMKDIIMIGLQKVEEKLEENSESHPQKDKRAA